MPCEYFDLLHLSRLHRLLNHLKPLELLGLTGTPERLDGQDVTEWFDNRITVELRLWEAIDVITPRVVVVEFQDILGPERAWTVPYADDFRADRYPTTDGMPNFAGASLPAFVKLGRRKGYRLVGANRYGFNAFFVRNGLADELLPEVPAAACLTHPKVREQADKRFATVAHLPWVEV